MEPVRANGNQEESKPVLPYVDTKELLRAKTLLFHYVYGAVGHTSIKCTMDLGIPDAINSLGGGPVTLSELSAALPKLHPSKVVFFPRLMRLLTQLGFFAKKAIADGGDTEGYVLTPLSKLLVKDNPMGLANLVQYLFDPFNYDVLYHMSAWLQSPATSVYEEMNGKALWESIKERPELNHLFNEAMASESSVEAQVLVRDCADVFQGIGSLVDVGGGTGTTATAIAKAFPEVKCMVLDLPHVVATVADSGGEVAMIAGDMFEHIPQADAILLKWILHDWNDDDCVRILQKCKKAIPPSGGKVIAIDMVVGYDKSDHKLLEAQLFNDMAMMMAFAASERNEEEWRSIISRAGFSRFTIKHVLGLKSLIEIYP